MYWIKALGICKLPPFISWYEEFANNSLADMNHFVNNVYRNVDNEHENMKSLRFMEQLFFKDLMKAIVNHNLHGMACHHV